MMYIYYLVVLLYLSRYRFKERYSLQFTFLYLLGRALEVLRKLNKYSKTYFQRVKGIRLELKKASSEKFVKIYRTYMDTPLLSNIKFN